MGDEQGKDKHAAIDEVGGQSRHGTGWYFVSVSVANTDGSQRNTTSRSGGRCVQRFSVLAMARRPHAVT